MSTVTINERKFDVDLIVFDKDGTLIALDVWGHQLEKWGRLVQADASLADEDLHRLYAQLGYDVEQKTLQPDTPIVVASIDQVLTIGAFVLHTQGVSWTAAEQIVHTAADRSLSAPPEPEMIQPIGDVLGTMQRLQQHGVRIGIATSDDRLPTERTIEIMGIGSLLEAVVCADDPIAMKPAPDGLLHISQQSGVPPERMLMVGDSMGDMVCGRAAGVAGCIRIGTPLDEPLDEVDTSIGSIDEIVVA